MQHTGFLVAVGLLQAGLSSALLHQHHASPPVQLYDTKQGYAYVTMSMVRKYMPGHSFRRIDENVLDGKELEQEAINTFGAERAHFEIKKQRNFVLKDAMENEDNIENAARQISRLAGQMTNVNSKYPLVVLTNDERLMNMSKEELPANVILESLGEYLPRKCAMASKNTMHFQKLNVFGLTQYKKLMWMDWDLELKQNIDDLFEKDTNDGKTVYGQRDDWQCTGKTGASASGGFCSGLMLFTPLKETVSSLIDAQGKSCWGDQVVIARHFDKKKTQETGREWRTWDSNVISFAPCQNKYKSMVIHHAELPNSQPGKNWK